MADFISGESKGDSLTYNKSWVVAPYAGFEPVTGLQMGFGGKLIFNHNKAEKTTYPSSFDLSVMYTLKNQLFIDPKFNVYFDDNEYYWRGIFDYTRFPRSFFGIGNNTREEDEESFDVSSISSKQMFYKQVASGFFVGTGFDLTRYLNVDPAEDGLLANEDIGGKDPHTLAALNLGFMYDSRDNVMNSTTGYFAKIRTSFFRPAIKSRFNFTKMEIDARKFWSVNKKLNNTIAFQLYSMLNIGNVPFTELAPLGDATIMRGYLEGRYLDRYYYATQIAYRFKIWKRIRGAVFSSVGDVGNNDRTFTFKDLKPAAGAGLRYIIIPSEQLSIRFDYAIGRNQSGIYIQIGEAF